MTTIICLAAVAIVIALGVYFRPRKEGDKPELPPIERKGYD